ncbi:UNVERIFIED_CONTAM: alpha/beta hydrolase, partial [Bifidobacterium longum]|nr:alpha/beta hydrolase [Bifidobacterium longum]
MKAASYIKPTAGKSYKLQRVAEELNAKQAPDNPKGRVEDAFVPMADGYAVPLRVLTPLVAYGAPLPEALDESSANGTPAASATSAIRTAGFPNVPPQILIKATTSHGHTH